MSRSPWIECLGLKVGLTAVPVSFKIQSPAVCGFPLTGSGGRPFSLSTCSSVASSFSNHSWTVSVRQLRRNNQVAPASTLLTSLGIARNSNSGFGTYRVRLTARLERVGVVLKPLKCFNVDRESGLPSLSGYTSVTDRPNYVILGDQLRWAFAFLAARRPSLCFSLIVVIQFVILHGWLNKLTDDEVRWLTTRPSHWAGTRGRGWSTPGRRRLSTVASWCRPARHSGRRRRRLPEKTAGERRPVYATLCSVAILKVFAVSIVHLTFQK